MTLDEALDLARGLSRSRFGSGPAAQDLARFVIDTLGVGFPCGFAEPYVESGPRFDGTDANVAYVVIDFDGTGDGDGFELVMTREEALGIAAAIARCALALPEGK